MTWREYHDATKHTPEALRRDRHALDWANMPDPFRHYEDAPLLDLPANTPAPDIPAMDVLGGGYGETTAKNGPELLSQLLFYSAAISATKVVPSTGYRYALRVNPSSGNLHPTEFHFRARGLQGWPDGLYHYRPSSHMAEQRASFDFDVTTAMEAPLTFILTSIAWREAWKYRDRAYRYCLLDIGHAAESLALAARAAGYDAACTGEFADDRLAEICQFSEDEWPMMIVTLRGAPIPLSRPVSGKPNPLSKEYVPYPSIDEIHDATKLRAPVPQLLPGRPFGETVRGRRSALDFIGGTKSMTRDQLQAILAMAAPHTIALYIYLHRVTDFEPGLYCYIAATAELKIIQAGDQQVIAAALSLQQELAGNACIAISMIANLERACAEHGPRGYRYAHFEAGAIGQRLYVAAEALGLRATGMGAFFDDQVHRYLNLAPAQGEVVYHFAIGYPVHDSRVEAHT